MTDYFKDSNEKLEFCKNAVLFLLQQLPMEKFIEFKTILANVGKDNDTLWNDIYAVKWKKLMKE